MSRNAINLILVLLFVQLCMLGCGFNVVSTANNQVIVAKAGLVQNVIAGNIVSLDGSESTDADNSFITYQWSIVSKPAVSVADIDNPNIVNPTFMADLPGQYSVQLIVTDAKSNRSEDSITVTVMPAGNVVPVANAGTALGVVTGSLVTLDGSSSNAENGGPLTYFWTFSSKPAGSEAALSSVSVAKPTFKADAAGLYTFDLIVNNGEFNSAAATVTVTATPMSAISISPLDITLGTGQVNQFLATATLATGASMNISTTAFWSSSNTAVATIGNTGLATAVGPGTTVITATVAGRSSSTSLTVGPSALVGIKVDKGIAYTLPIGHSLQLTATGTYTDKTKKDITEQASWTPRYANSPATCLAVSDTPGTKGAVSTLGGACYEQVSVSCGGLQTLISISVK